MSNELMSGQARDSQRSKLYIAEHAIHGIDFETVADMQSYVDALTSARWFRSRWGQRRIVVKDGRRRRSACGGYGSISMPRHTRYEIIVLHEIAHCLAILADETYAYHGPEFAGVLVTLVRNVMGADDARKLRESFRQHRVRLNMKAVPAAGTRKVETGVERQAASHREKTKPLTTYERRQAAAFIRRAVASGAFGPSGRKPRVHALATARALEAE